VVSRSHRRSWRQWLHGGGSRAMKKIPVIISSVLLAVGLAIFLCDAYVSYRYGFGINDVAGMTEDGGPID